MPTHALLGATGSTGSAILRALLASPPADLTLNIFVRSRSKLLKRFPDLTSTKSINVQITEAAIDDNTALQSCLKGAETIYQCIASNDSAPGMTVSQDIASSVISALEALRKLQGASYTLPTVVLLRTASLNPTFVAKSPWLLEVVVHFCLYHVYADLDLAAKKFEKVAEEEAGLLEYIFVDPGALHDADGTECTGHELLVDEKAPTMIGYPDLGAGFVEIAQRKSEFRGKGVGVEATGKVNTNWGALMKYNLRGIYGRITGW